MLCISACEGKEAIALRTKISTGVSFCEFVSANTSCAFSRLVTPISPLYIYVCRIMHTNAGVLVNTVCMCGLWCDGIALVWGCLVGVV